MKRISGEIVKRSLDFLAALIGLILLLPLLFWIAWHIRRDSAGPVLFRGRRTGRYGQEFAILKFRTMYECPESHNGPPVTAFDDPRVTPFGKWLRRTKLNELPQLWNVLKGEMSLVGPRPEAAEIVAAWPESVRAEILSVRPGISSPTSVRYRNEENLLHSDKVVETYISELMPSKLFLDTLYVRRRSFWTDLDILFLTFLVLLPGGSQFQPSNRQLLRGPFDRLRKKSKYMMFYLGVILFASGSMGLIWQTDRMKFTGLVILIVVLLASLSFMTIFIVREGLKINSPGRLKPNLLSNDEFHSKELVNKPIEDT